MVEIYKIKNNLNLPIIDFMFERRNSTITLEIVKSLQQKEKEP